MQEWIAGLKIWGWHGWQEHEVYGFLAGGLMFFCTLFLYWAARGIGTWAVLVSLPMLYILIYTGIRMIIFCLHEDILHLESANLRYDFDEHLKADKRAGAVVSAETYSESLEQTPSESTPRS